MVFILLFLSTETWVDTIHMYVPPQESIRIHRKVGGGFIPRIPAWIEEALSNKIDHLKNYQVVFPGGKQIGIMDDTIYILRNDSLFRVKDNGETLVMTGVNSFNFWKDKIAVAKMGGDVYVDGKRSFRFKPPVFIGGGDVPVIMDGDGYVYTLGGLFFKSFHRKGRDSIPYTVSGKTTFFKKSDIFLRYVSLPIVSRTSRKYQYNRGLFWVDRLGRVWWKEWKNGWGIRKFTVPESNLPDVDMGTNFYFLTRKKIILSYPDGRLSLFEERDGKWVKIRTKEQGFSFATFAYHNGKIYAGLKDGRVVLLDSLLNIEETIDTVSSFASPAFIGNELLIGSGAGYIKGFNRERFSPPVRISSGDLNGDGKDDLAVIDGDGILRLFCSPNYKEDSTSFPMFMEFSSLSLSDLDGDGQDEIVVCDIYGRINIFKKGENGFYSVDKWRFQKMMGIESLSDYLNRYVPPGRTFTRRDDQTVDAIIKLIKRTPPMFLDEVAFTIVHLPDEVIRTMVRMGDIDLLLNNAKDIYSVSNKLKYVKIAEKKDYTTLVYEGKYTLPKDIYYYYVVMPRILYEIPSRVNINYWKKPPSYYGVDSLEWLQKRMDVYKGGGQFWRDVFLRDSLFGETVVDAVKDAKTLKEAVQRVHRFQSWAYKGNRMRFGYKTQDIQPLVIYYKSYGSCGEQSILQCALARTVLIPNYVVVDRGEDHQWNHFYMPYPYRNGEVNCDSWHHQDVNGKIKTHLGNPKVSSEGMGKDVSAVVGWRGDDFQFPVTKCGYTGTGRVDVRVQDDQGSPIDGALVVVRSHWNRRNTPAIWEYTDVKGRVQFNLGYEPYGYTIDVLTPNGAGGKNLFFIKEGETLSVEITVPGIGIEREPLKSSVDSLEVVNAASLFRGFNFVTGTPYRISSPTLKKIGYAGTGIEEFFVGRPIYKITKRHNRYYLVNPMRNLSLKGDVLVRHQREKFPPKISISPLSDTIFQGEPVKFTFNATDNGRIRVVRISFEDSVVKEYHSQWGIFILDTGKGGALLPGRYRVTFTAIDCAKNTTSKTANIIVKPTSVFKYQIVHQDPSPDSLPRGSWVYGPIKLKGLPFASIMIESDAKGVDIDLYVYRDKDGDKRVTSKEKVASSTSPTSREIVFLKNPPDGEYWIYVNGCTVPDGKAMFNFYTSFTVNEKGEAR